MHPDDTGQAHTSDVLPEEGDGQLERYALAEENEAVLLPTGSTWHRVDIEVTRPKGFLGPSSIIHSGSVDGHPLVVR